MTSEAISVKTRQRKQPKFYVYYNDWTGQIVSVGRREIEDAKAPFIVTDDPVAQRIMSGEANEHYYTVAMTRNDEFEIMEKDETVRLRELEEELFEVPRVKLENWDVRAKIYTKNKKIVFEINDNSLRRLSSFKLRRDLKVESEHSLQFFITERNNPDKLIETVDIEPVALLKSKNICINAEDLLKYINLNDIGILTRRQFENYYFELVDDKYIETDLDTNVYKNDQIHRAEYVDDCHLSFVQTDTSLILKSNVAAEQFDDLGLYDRFMTFYIVGATPDEFIDRIHINVAKLRIGQPIKFQADFDIDDVNFVYHNPKLIVGKQKQT